MTSNSLISRLRRSKQDEDDEQPSRQQTNKQRSRVEVGKTVAACWSDVPTGGTGYTQPHFFPSTEDLFCRVLKLRQSSTAPRRILLLLVCTPTTYTHKSNSFENDREPDIVLSSSCGLSRCAAIRLLLPNGPRHFARDNSTPSNVALLFMLRSMSCAITKKHLNRAP